MPSLENIEFIRSLSRDLARKEERHDRRGESTGVVYGIVEQVDDPLDKSRVRVSLDGQGHQYMTDWIPVVPSFRGRQPESLIGHRVEVSFADGDITRGSVTQVVDDDENEESIVTGVGFRLPCYESGTLPPALEENQGLLAVELNGPYSSDWLVVCLRRRGTPMWVRMCDLSHGHGGQDRGIQGADSDGDAEQPVNEYAVHDTVFPTTQEKYAEQSYLTPADTNWYGAAS
jgi:hypothetical protein